MNTSVRTVFRSLCAVLLKMCRELKTCMAKSLICFSQKMLGGFQECVLPVNPFFLKFFVDRDFFLNVNLFK